MIGPGSMILALLGFILLVVVALTGAYHGLCWWRFRDPKDLVWYMACFAGDVLILISAEVFIGKVTP